MDSNSEKAQKLIMDKLTALCSKNTTENASEDSISVQDDHVALCGFSDAKKIL